MTNPYARPADQPEEDVTIPLVPDSGYASPAQQPFADETLVDPLGPNPWAAPRAENFGYTPTPAPAAAQPPQGGYPTAAEYWQRSGVPQQPQAPAAPAVGVPYAQPTFQGYPQDAQQAGQQWLPATVSDPVRPEYGGGYSYNYRPAGAEHPNAIPALVLGIVGLVLFPLVAPLAWHLAAKGQREAALDPDRWRSGGMLTAGKILGIIGTVFLALGMLMIGFFILMIVAAS